MPGIQTALTKENTHRHCDFLCVAWWVSTIFRIPTALAATARSPVPAVVIAFWGDRLWCGVWIYVSLYSASRKPSEYKRKRKIDKKCNKTAILHNNYVFLRFFCNDEGVKFIRSASKRDDALEVWHEILDRISFCFTE